MPRSDVLSAWFSHSLPRTNAIYRTPDRELIPDVQATVASFSLADYDAVLNHIRGSDPDQNGTSIVTDYVLDAIGNSTKTIDGRNIEHTTAYDSRRRQIEQALAAERSPPQPLIVAQPSTP